MAGRLISFEGGEGAGKSTAIQAAQERLDRHGIEVVLTREPGGTRIGEAIRSVLLDPVNAGLCAETELLLMFASRAQLVREVIVPALERGAWVLADRFADASFAYQGGGRGLPAVRIAELERWTVGIRPDLTLLLDVPVAVGLGRARGRSPADRIEAEPDAFFERVRAAYLARADAEPRRFHVIDASRPPEAVAAAVRAAIDALLEAHAA
ncbi:MAG TPA: dTMP kinase [Xanthomonadaceae bacterium]|nr:dTMP kinase [Xanthomonadaceae bacterium]